MNPCGCNCASCAKPCSSRVQARRPDLIDEALGALFGTPKRRTVCFQVPDSSATDGPGNGPIDPGADAAANLPLFAPPIGGSLAPDFGPGGIQWQPNGTQGWASGAGMGNPTATGAIGVGSNPVPNPHYYVLSYGSPIGSTGMLPSGSLPIALPGASAVKIHTIQGPVAPTPVRTQFSTKK